MKTRCLISFMVVGALMLLCQPAIADDLDDLKAAVNKYTMAINTGDVETQFAILDDKLVRLGSEDGIPHAIPNKEVKERIKQAYMKRSETHSTRLMRYKPDFRVIGNTGLVWGLVQRTRVNKKSGITRISTSKNSLTFVKSDGKWILVLIHSTPIPPTQTLY